MNPILIHSDRHVIRSDGHSVVWHIISALPAARSRLADGQISFGPVSGSIDAVAVLPAAALVCFDQCSTQNLFDRGQVAHDSAATSAQHGGRKIRVAVSGFATPGTEASTRSISRRGASPARDRGPLARDRKALRRSSNSCSDAAGWR